MVHSTLILSSSLVSVVQLCSKEVPLTINTFSVRRLLGSARSSHSVCAEERNSHCIDQYPALESQKFFFPSCASVALARSSHKIPRIGESKGSADHYAVQSPLRGAVEKANQQNTQAKPNQTPTQNPNKQRTSHPVKDVLRRGWVSKTINTKVFFFCANASIALARSLCKCLLAVLNYSK